VNRRCRLCGSVEEPLEGLGLERPGEQEALTLVALLPLEALELCLVLDAFAERLEVERLAELDEGVDEGRGLLGGGDAGDEGAVDLERVDRELA
jgi:hypothetical protein